MKRFILLPALLAALVTFGQVPALIVNSPAAVAGVTFNIGLPGASLGLAVDGTLTPVTGKLVLAQDNTPGATSEEGCNAFSNAADMAGNICLVARGNCTFDAKVDNAFAAGAIGVLVYNNQAGVSVMGGFSAATIPAIMIETSLANALKAEMLNGLVNVTITGSYRYPQDLSCGISDMVMTPYATLPLSEVGGSKIYLGAYPKNIGVQTLNSATVTANVTFNGSPFYSSTAAIPSVMTDSFAYATVVGNAADSTLTLTAGATGEYVITYTASADDNLSNNSSQQTLRITNNTMSKLPVDAQGNPPVDEGQRIGGTATSTEWGNLFHITHGNGYAMTKATWAMKFAGSVTDLGGKTAQLNVRKWTDANQDGLISVDEVGNFIGYGGYIFTSSDQMVNNTAYITSDVYDLDGNPRLLLQDNTYYVVSMVVDHADDAYVGCSSVRDYGLLSRLDKTDHVYYPSVIITDDAIYSGFADDHSQPSIAFEITQVTGTDAVAAQGTFQLAPNPASHVLNVQLNRATPATLTVMSLTDQTLLSQRTEAAQQQAVAVDISTLPAGLYLMQVSTAQGVESRMFSVVR